MSRVETVVEDLGFAFSCEALLNFAFQVLQYLVKDLQSVFLCRGKAWHPWSLLRMLIVTAKFSLLAQFFQFRDFYPRN